jgi:hypothetical protein
LEGLGDHEETASFIPKHASGVALLGKVGKEGAAFFEQGTGAVACQHVWQLEQLVEHRRTSER